ncbi:MAG: xanthine dehydrogenase family protein molybdopterin-binding subunit [Alphaproteobacteria bacterium]|nr:xanthine dehydrogenase family protein molybdopterin-binding subunit [Alphaproteobacteria bacterium]
MGEFALGQPVTRFEDQRLLTGGGRYIDDFKLPHMAYGVVLRSPHAHARIRAIDTAQAAAMPGVLTILTGADWAASGFEDLPRGKGRTRRDGSPLFRGRYPALAPDKVRYAGDAVAFVVAETRDQAQDAAERVEVDYEPLPANADTAKAIEPGTPAVWDDCPDNICFVHLGGDLEAVEAALAAADHVVTRRFVINRVTAATTEPRGCIGDYNRAEGSYTLYTTLQGTHGYRADLAGVLTAPENKVRVVAGDIGGSFGMKSGVYNEGPLALLASRRIGRPVKWISSRSEAFVSDAQARDNVTDVSLALNKDGDFLALQVKTIAPVGAYLQAGGEGSSVNNLGTLASTYRTPAISVDVTAVFTNTNPMRPYRGNGRPEAAHIIEGIVDAAADELGIDPVALRRRNMIPPDAMPFKTGLTFTYDCGKFEENMDMALAMADFTGFESRRATASKSGKLRGIGISNSVEKAASPGIEGAEVRFDRTGTATVLTGSITQGQGHETVYKQLVCDRLGLDPEDVNYVAGDTDKVAYGQGTGGSRSATIGGSALFQATEKIVAKARKIAAHMLDVQEADVGFEDGVFAAEGSNRSLTIKEVAKAAVNPNNLPDGMEPGLVELSVYANKIFNFPNGCHVCELEIDPDTGAVEIVNYNVVDDVGTVMNPLLLHGQIQGGIAQGLGQALMENVAFDTDGQQLSGSFMDYAMPKAAHFGPIAVKSNPVPTATNPLGVKGAGEAGNVGALPALMNALVDALSPLGIRQVPMPATPEKLWRLIRDARAGAAQG